MFRQFYRLVFSAGEFYGLWFCNLNTDTNARTHGSGSSSRKNVNCKLNDVNIESFYQILGLKSSGLSSFGSEWSLGSNSLLHNNPIEGGTIILSCCESV